MSTALIGNNFLLSPLKFHFQWEKNCCQWQITAQNFQTMKTFLTLEQSQLHFFKVSSKLVVPHKCFRNWSIIPHKCFRNWPICSTGCRCSVQNKYVISFSTDQQCWSRQRKFSIKSFPIQHHMPLDFLLSTSTIHNHWPLTLFNAWQPSAAGKVMQLWYEMGLDISQYSRLADLACT